MFLRGSANFADPGPRGSRPSVQPASAAPWLRKAETGLGRLREGAHPGSLGSGPRAPGNRRKTGDSGLIRAEPQPLRPAPRRGVPWAGKRQVYQLSLACWIEAPPPTQRGPWSPVTPAESPGDSGRLGGWAPRAGALAAAPGARRYPGPGQRPLRPHTRSGPARGETRVASTAASSFSRSPSPLLSFPSPLGEGGETRGIAGPRRMRPPLPLGLRCLAGMKHRP